MSYSPDGEWLAGGTLLFWVLSIKLRPVVGGQVRQIRRRTKYIFGIFQMTVSSQLLWMAAENLL